MAHAPLITDAELLALGIASDALASVDASIRLAHINAATGRALSFVAKQHTLPLVSWGWDLRGAVAAIAAYTLLGRRGYNPAGGSDESIEKAYKEATAWLGRVAKGTIELVDVVDSTPAVHENAPLVATSGAPLWPDYAASLGDDCE
jgi:phage gp36-like protein